MRSSSKKTVGLLLTCGVLTAGPVPLAACGDEEDPTRISRVDKTGSSEGSDDLCRKNLVAYAKETYEGIEGERGTMFVDTFNLETDAAPRLDTRVDFQVNDKVSSSVKRIEQTIEEKLGELDGKVEDLLATTPPGGSTDMIAMFAGLAEAAHATKAETVWVCSDGYDKRLQGNPTPAQAKKMIQSLDKDGLPDLDGIKVIFDTSTIEGRSDLDSSGLAAIRVFNEELIERSGGELVGYGTGAGTA